MRDMKWFRHLDKFRRTESFNSKPPRIAIVGCGAIVELYYLPAFTEHLSVLTNLILVDKNKTRAQELASKFKISTYHSDYREILGAVDGAIIAVPHHLHYPISMDFLSNGVHVLCEKPIAELPSEAKEMVAQAEKSKVTISVNNTRRLFPAYARIKELISSRKIGNLISINYTDGEIFQWPTVSGFYFQKKTFPKGVLLDRGAHGLDVICWWLGVKPKLVSSENDSFGGVEGVAVVKLEHNECSIGIKLSWLTRLQNRYTIVGEQGVIEGGIEEWSSVTIKYKSGKTEKIKLSSKEKKYNDFARRIVANFIEVVGKGAKSLIPASEVIPSIELIEECYKTATRLNMPWFETLEMLDGS